MIVIKVFKEKKTISSSNRDHKGYILEYEGIIKCSFIISSASG
jgi:hypothetical protein